VHAHVKAAGWLAGRRRIGRDERRRKAEKVGRKMLEPRRPPPFGAPARAQDPRAHHGRMEIVLVATYYSLFSFYEARHGHGL
jgi:hypothetical protein